MAVLAAVSPQPPKTAIIGKRIFLPLLAELDISKKWQKLMKFFEKKKLVSNENWTHNLRNAGRMRYQLRHRRGLWSCSFMFFLFFSSFPTSLKRVLLTWRPRLWRLKKRLKAVPSKILSFMCTRYCMKHPLFQLYIILLHGASTPLWVPILTPFLNIAGKSNFILRDINVALRDSLKISYLTYF